MPAPRLGRTHRRDRPRSRRRRPPARRGADGRHAGRPAAGRHPGARLHRGLGRPVLHAEPGAPRRRGDPHRDDGADAVRHPADAAVRRRRARARACRLLQPVQPGQAQHPARPAQAGGGRSSPTTWSRTATSSPTTSPPASSTSSGFGYEKLRRHQARHHPDLDVGLRADRPVPLVPRLRPAGVGAVRPVRAHRLRRRRAGRDRRVVPRSQRRADGRLRHHRRPASPRPHRRGPVHRPVAVGGRARAHGRRTARMGHATSASRRAAATTTAVMAPHETYKASGDDDKWVSIAVGTEQEWHALCATPWASQASPPTPGSRTAELRKQNEAALDEIITAWTSARDRWDAAETLQQAGVAAFPSMSNKDLAEDPHLDGAGLPRASSSILSSAGASTPASRGRCRRHPARRTRRPDARHRHRRGSATAARPVAAGDRAPASGRDRRMAEETSGAQPWAGS